MELRTYTRDSIQGKRVLLRCDLDVSVNQSGHVDEFHDLRLERIIPTLVELFSFGAAQVVMLGHRGRPQGKVDPALSLAPVCDRVAELARAEGLDEPIAFVEDSAADPIQHRDADLVMLENLRFWPGEQDGSAAFARTLSRWGEVYVNDAFGAGHRHDTSITILPRLFPDSFAGRALAEEVEQLEAFLAHAAHPFVAIVGGAKIGTKLPLLKLLAERSQHVLVGGALASTILKSRGMPMGDSLVEETMLAKAAELSHAVFELPEDAILSGGRTAPVTGISEGEAMLDIGPATIKKFVQRIREAKTILWNGPMGTFEDPRFAAGSEEIARAIAENSAARSLAGGGETVELIERLGIMQDMDFVSAGGGASLSFLTNSDMPGLDALRILYQ